METGRVTRLEVIDQNVGRILVRHGVRVWVSYQDNDMTLKIFVEDRVPKIVTDENVPVGSFGIIGDGQTIPDGAVGYSVDDVIVSFATVPLPEEDGS